MSLFLFLFYVLIHFYSLENMKYTNCNLFFTLINFDNICTIHDGVCEEGTP